MKLDSFALEVLNQTESLIISKIIKCCVRLNNDIHLKKKVLRLIRTSLNMNLCSSIFALSCKSFTMYWQCCRTNFKRFRTLQDGQAYLLVHLDLLYPKKMKKNIF